MSKTMEAWLEKFDKAAEEIAAFWKFKGDNRTFEEMYDEMYNDPEHVRILSTTTDNGKHEHQYYADLVSFKIYFYLDGKFADAIWDYNRFSTNVRRLRNVK